VRCQAARSIYDCSVSVIRTANSVGWRLPPGVPHRPAEGPSGAPDGELITAQELYQLGSVRAVVSPGDLLSTDHELAAVFGKMSPIGVRLAKEPFDRVKYMSIKEGYRIEQKYTARLAAFEDRRESARAWIEHRDPEWQWPLGLPCPPHPGEPLTAG
jgi:enoyl-CoA hydratase/carnithine racemase